MAAVLRNFQGMWDGYPLPGGSAEAVKRLIGGRVNSPTIANTCVVRLSRALHASGNPIPNDPTDDLLTVPGADGLPYALRVREFQLYMQRRYGAPTLSHAYPNGNGGDIPPPFLGQQGIIAFEVDGWSDATGHFDLWNGRVCRHQAYFNRAKTVHLWTVLDTAAHPQLRRSVGAGGRNQPQDVEIVQRLLVERGFDPGPVDGIAGSRTTAAIRAFQSRFLRKPDGRVDPDGRTFRELLGQ